MLNNTYDTLLGLPAGLELVLTENAIAEDANRPSRSAIDIDKIPVENPADLIADSPSKRSERYGLQSHYRQL